MIEWFTMSMAQMPVWQLILLMLVLIWFVASPAAHAVMMHIMKNEALEHVIAKELFDDDEDTEEEYEEEEDGQYRRAISRASQGPRLFARRRSNSLRGDTIKPRRSYGNA